MKLGHYKFPLVAALLMTATLPSPHLSLAQAAPIVRPGEVWLDNRGKEIQAHGGGILYLRHTFYWFGEDRSQSNDPEKRYVACYSSTDLAHWKFRNQVLAISNPENLGNSAILERPKVFYNHKTRTFVMYMHLDGPGYKLARVAIAVSKTVDGDYKYVRSFRPLGQESRDIGQFVDDDGAAYLIFESRPTHGFFIAKLSSDYMNVEKQMSFVPAPLSNPNVYATAPSLSGPWTTFTDIAPPEVNTYDSQSSMLLKVSGSKATTVIYMEDRWKPKELWDSRYIWMPIEIGSGKLSLPNPMPWSIDVRTGITIILPPEASDSSKTSSERSPQ
jgi:hypothetical protein